MSRPAGFIDPNLKLVLIDNYDSFTYNIVQILLGLGLTPQVIKNDELTLEELAARDFSHLILSPGPGHPEEACLTLPAVKHFASQRIPVLGICLGHQAIALAFGGQISRAQEVHHGEVSWIENSGEGIFSHLPPKFKGTRYHSLTVESPLPECLKMTAWTQREDGGRDLMALQHKSWPCFGVQFHPEAILSEFGSELLAHFCQL